MSECGDLEAENSDPSVPRCPRCDGPVTMVSVTGPTEAIAAPSGCRAPPGALE